MQRVFRDEGLQESFEREGFIKIKLFSLDKIKNLSDYYATVHEKHEAYIRMRCLYSTMETGDKALITEVDKLVKETIMDDVSKLFINYQPLIASYLVKASGDDTELCPHQDLTFVDEPEQCSFNVWIPLQKTDSQTGQLRVVRGSHKIESTLRVVPSYPWPFEAYKELFMKMNTAIDTEPGDCVILNHAVIHSSAANNGPNARVAVIIGFCSAPAPIYYYYMKNNNSNQIEKYAMKSDDYYDIMADGRPSSAKFMGHLSHEFKAVGEHMIRRWIKADPNFNFWEKCKLLYFTNLKTGL